MGVVAITTFIPWLISTASLEAVYQLPYVLFLGVYYMLLILLFGVAFGFYFWGHKEEDVFTVMGTALFSFLLYDLLYIQFVYQGEVWFLNYFDWFLPLFLISSTIYWVGKFLK